MATIKRGTTKSAGQLVNYAEKKATVKRGENLDIDYAKSQMRITREMFAKNDGIQAHHVVQSFKPDEITPEKANDLGLELAREIAPNHEVAVYTHTDKKHIHNHLVINSVNFETGNKYHAHGKKALQDIRDKNDGICRKHELSIAHDYTASVRYTLAEKQILDKGQISWKAEMREAINYVKEESHDFESFKNTLKNDFDIDTKLRGETLSFKHPDQKKFVRGKTLGADYEKGGLEHEFTGKARTQKTRTTESIDWNEYERRNQLHDKNGNNRTSERVNSAENRPISRKYREEQRANEREYQSNDQSDRKQQQSVKQQDKGFER